MRQPLIGTADLHIRPVHSSTRSHSFRRPLWRLGKVANVSPPFGVSLGINQDGVVDYPRQE